MDRVIVYPSQLPAAEDFLATQREAMRSIGLLISAVTGNATIVEGMDALPTAPAGMAVRLTSGHMFTLAASDGSPFGVLPAEPGAMMKDATFWDSTFPIAAPTGQGEEVVYLIQAAFTEQDAVPSVLDYYNAANPSQPWSGPGNSGQPQFRRRQTRVAVQVKAGAPALAGQAVAPATDPSWVPLWTIRVGHGATAVTAANIQAHPQAPRFRSRLTTGLTAADLSHLATQAALAAEAQARASGDASVNSRVTTEVAALNALIAQNVTALGAADQSLWSALGAESQTRFSQDQAVLSVVNTLRDVQLGGYITQFQTMWQRFPGGMIMQGGRGVAPASGFTTTSGYQPFPVAFPNGCVLCIATLGGPDPDGVGVTSNSQDGWTPTIAVGSLGAAGFIFSMDNLSPGSGPNGDVPFNKQVAFNYVAFGW